MGTNTISDTDLLVRAHDGDLDALRVLVDEHVHPAWRIAVVAAPHPALAPSATVDGFCDGLQAAHRHPDQFGLRVRIVTATRHAAQTASAADLPARPAEPDVVLAAFRALPEQWRTALWLMEVEGGQPEQVAPVLGLNRTAAAALADRATAGLRDRLSSDVAERAATPECKRALTKLPAQAAGKLTAAEREAVGQHLATCGSCAVWLAALVSPRPALRRLISTPPDLTADIEARWLELIARNRSGWIAPITERAIGAAAAAVLAIGLGGAALLGGRDRGEAGPELASPAGASPSTDTTGDGGGDAASTTVTVPGSTGTGTGATGGSTGGSSSTGTGSSSPGTSSTNTARSGGPAPTSSPTTAPPTTAPPTTPPPDNAPPSPPPTDEETVEVAIGLLGGTVAVGVGECTGASVAGTPIGCAPETDESSDLLDVKLPGLPEINL